MEGEELSRGKEMALQEEPLYDFPEPSQPSESKRTGLQRGRDSLKSVSVLDRLLLTVPVWLQLSINPATALHILQREPPGAFLVRKSRTSKRNVLCLRLADDSVPSFVQQVGIREDHSTFCLETSAISFPDLPRLIAFYCVSRDVLPFPLQLPEAIARATSHKQLESISHMGVEFWNSHLNFRGPREAPKEWKDEKKKPEPVTVLPSLPTSHPNAATQSSTVVLPDSATALDPADQLSTTPQDDAALQSKGSPTLFQEFCPITTRGPRELNCGPGMAALCFVNPLFLQSHTSLHRRRLFKRSIKVRISTETSTLLSPPLEPPPPPPLMPKKKGKCKSKSLTQKQPQGSPSESLCLSQSQTQSEPQLQHGPLQPQMPNSHDTPSQLQGSDVEQAQAQLQPTQFQMQERDQPQDQTQLEERLARAQIAEGQDEFRTGEAQAQPLRPLPDYSEYQHPPSRINTPLSPSLSHIACPLLHPKVSSSLSPRDSPNDPPSLSPKPFSLSPFTSPSASPTVEVYHTPMIAGKTCEEGQAEEQEDEEDEEEEGDEGETGSEEEGEDMNLLLEQQIYASSLNETESCSSLSSLEEAEETPPLTPLLQDGDAPPGFQ